ncbi:glycosyltransferase family 39 protein [Marinicellulosiphila megalodicopiae]|uniref:glycosyltransferase family 39 protein n=1 Tax=Marinicellulosiphila megalodicopiae TaxID=2724896 RepID=UPI003BB0864E
MNPHFTKYGYWYLTGILFLLPASWLMATLVNSFQDVNGRMLFTHAPFLKTSFTHFSYFIMLTVLVVFFILNLLYFQKKQIDFFRILKTHALELSFLLLATVLVYFSVEQELRVFADESNLAAIAKSMTYDNTVYNSTMGNYYYQDYRSFSNVTPKRPLIFPTLVAVLHTISGYRIANIFILNSMVLFALLSIIYFMVKTRFGLIAAISSVFLVLAQPVVSITSSSGGFDILSTLFALLTCIAFARYYKEQDAFSLSILIVTFIIFANIRYESLMYGGLMLVMLLVFKRVNWLSIKQNLILVGPIVLWLSPTIWQRILTAGTYENPDDRGVLALDSLFMDHVSGMLSSHLRFDFFLPYSPILTFISIAVIIFWVGFLVIKNQTDKAVLDVFKSPLTWFLVLCLIINLIVFLMHHNGRFDHPTSFRFYLIFSIAMSLIPITLFYFKNKNFQYSLLGLSVVLFLGYHSAAITDRSTKSLTSERIVNFVNEIIDEQPNNNYMLVVDIPGRFTPQDIAVVSLGHAKNNHHNLQRNLDTYLYQRTIVFQRVNLSTKEPIESDQLPEGYVLQELDGLKISGGEYLRASKMLRTPKIEKEESSK